MLFTIKLADLHFLLLLTLQRDQHESRIRISQDSSKEKVLTGNEYNRSIVKSLQSIVRGFAA